MDDVAVGDLVKHAVTQREGRVSEVDSSRREALVEFSSYAAWVKFEQLIDLRAAQAPKVAACVSCKEPNEYQPPDALFTCGQCRHEASLREDAPETQKSRVPVATYNGKPLLNLHPDDIKIGVATAAPSAPGCVQPTVILGSQSVTTAHGTFRVGDVVQAGGAQIFTIKRFANFGSDAELATHTYTPSVLGVSVNALRKLSPNVKRGVPLSPSDIPYLQKQDSVRYVGANTALANAEGVIVNVLIAPQAIVEVVWKTVRPHHRSIYLPPDLELIP